MHLLARRESATPEDQAPGVSAAAEHAQLSGRGGRVAWKMLRGVPAGQKARQAKGSFRGGGASDARSLPPRPPATRHAPRATRRPSTRRLPVALATVAQRLPEGAPVSRRIPSPAPHCPAIFAWAQRRNDNKKWRSGARRRLRQVCGGGRSGGSAEAARRCPGPQGTGDLGLALLLKRHLLCLRGEVMTSGSRVKGGAHPFECLGRGRAVEASQECMRVCALFGVNTG